MELELAEALERLSHGMEVELGAASKKKKDAQMYIFTVVIRHCRTRFSHTRFYDLTRKIVKDR